MSSSKSSRFEDTATSSAIDPSLVAQQDSDFQHARTLDHQLNRNPSDPPLYLKDEADLRAQVQKLADTAQDDNQQLPILEFPAANTPPYHLDAEADATTLRRQDIVNTYFDAISTKKDEVVGAFIEYGLVTTETTNRQGRTPLLAAIESGNIRTVQQLMDFDADVNAFGAVALLPPHRYYRKSKQVERTPLMLAAEKGNLTIVKLLMETYGADDAMIAPDGELGLRLAASNGHREVVNYLPSRRGGGFRRWRTKHRKAMLRVKRAVGSIYWFFKVLLYEIPKFVVWTVPKHAVVLPVVDGAKWLHNHWRELPHRIAMWAKEVGRKLKKIPKMVRDWIAAIPRAIKEFAQFIWRGIKRFPRAVRIALVWMWGGMKRVGNSVFDVLARFASLLHTAFAALLSFFRHVTLKDIWDGFVALLRAVVIEGPKKLWDWLGKFGEVTLKMLEAMWGWVGTVIWWLFRGSIEVFIYLPKKILDILVGFGQSVAGGCQEVLIWMDPKRTG